MVKTSDQTAIIENKTAIPFSVLIQTFFREYLVMVAIIILVVLTTIVQPRFISVQNIYNILSQLGSLSVVALGMTFVIICGYIDLSVAGIINLVAMVTITLIDPLGQVMAFSVGLGLGVVLGGVNGLLIVSSGATMQSEGLFLTFGMSTFYGALALIISGGATHQMRWIEADYSLFTTIGSGSVGILPVAVIIFIGCLFVMHFFLSKTYIGRSISLCGGNKMTAWLAGIPVKRTIILVFAVSGLMAALGAIILFSRITHAAPVLGVNYEINAILAVVVGGTTLKGGKGSVLRTVMGIVLVVLLSNCMNLLGVSTYMQTIMSGLVLVLAIWLDNRKEEFS